MIYTDKPEDSPILWDYLHKRTGLPWSTDLRVLGTLRGLAPAAVVGYNCWVGNGVFMHVVFEDSHALTRELLREAFIYPFVACDRQVIYGMTPITNEVAIRFNKKVGFKELFRTSDFVLFEMKREDCRWIQDGWEKQRSSSTGL